MEVGILAQYPRHEFRDLRMRAKRFRRSITTLDLAIGEQAVDGAVADRMQRRGFAAAAALRHDVVPFHPAAQRPPAQEAGFGQRRSQWRPMNQPVTVTPTTTQKMTTPQKDQGLCA